MPRPRTFTRRQLEAAFVLWERRHREAPAEYLSADEVMAQSPGDAGAAAADTLYGILEELFPL